LREENPDQNPSSLAQLCLAWISFFERESHDLTGYERRRDSWDASDHHRDFTFGKRVETRILGESLSKLRAS
jgi:hypothetical protein